MVSLFSMFSVQEHKRVENNFGYLVWTLSTSHNDSLVRTVTDYTLVVLQLEKKETVVLRVAKLFKMIQMLTLDLWPLTPDLWSLQCRLLCHNFFAWVKELNFFYEVSVLFLEYRMWTLLPAPLINSWKALKPGQIVHAGLAQLRFSYLFFYFQGCMPSSASFTRPSAAKRPCGTWYGCCVPTGRRDETLAELEKRAGGPCCV